MSRGRLTEAALSLFAAPDCAASIVGDLLEESRSRPRGWFTLQAIRAGAALCFASTFSAPLRSFALATSGFFVYTFTYVTLIVFTGALGELRYYPGYPELSLVTASMSFWIRLALVVAVANFFTGIVVTRYVASRRFGAVAPLLVFWLAAWIGWPVFAALIFAISWPLIAAGALAFPFFCVAPLLAGAGLGQRSRSIAA